MQQLEGFGPWFRAVRQAAGLTLHDVESRTGIYTGNISKYETGRDLPTVQTQERLMASIDLDAAEQRLRGQFDLIQQAKRRRCPLCGARADRR